MPLFSNMSKNLHSLQQGFLVLITAEFLSMESKIVFSIDIILFGNADNFHLNIIFYYHS